MTQYSGAAGSIPAEQYTFRALRANTQMERPLVGRASQVRTRPERIVQIPGQRDWRFGPRLGKDAHGLCAQKATTPTEAPPAARQATGRKVTAFLKTDGQVGHPTSISTDAQLGNSVMANQSAGILFGSCKGDGSTRVRLEGSCMRAHPSAKHEPPRRAKVGNCPCCATATHSAAPARYMGGRAARG